ncbi:MAG: glycosyltransferase family 4 protein [Candidatus Berkelbacteria bacterium]|nr:glycosyltransferase family 4 protein [Candidatus Berkelbacteria bacterium]
MNVLTEHGNHVQIYVRGGRYYPKDDPIWDLPNVTWGVRYMPLDKFSHFTSQYVNMLHFVAWLRQYEIDIVITNEDVSCQMAKRCKQLGYIVGTYIDYYKKETLSQFKVYDFLLCNTKRHHSVFQKFPNAFYIPWGTDINLFRPQSHNSSEKTSNETVFFHSANFGGRNCRKGTDLLLEAFQQVTGNVRLIIHSQAPLSKFGNDAVDIVKGDERIQFIERTVPAPGLYHLGDVFVYPSRLEGIGLCVPEALACGLPVITTDNAPMNEFVKHGVNGLLVRVTQTRIREDGYYWPEKIADTVDLTKQMQAYVNDKPLLELHKQQARRSAETHLDWMKNANELGSKLQTLLNETIRRRRPSSSERLVWWSEAQYVLFLTFIRSVARKMFRR